MDLDHPPAGPTRKTSILSRSPAVPGLIGISPSGFSISGGPISGLPHLSAHLTHASRHASISTLAAWLVARTTPPSSSLSASSAGFSCHNSQPSGPTYAHKRETLADMSRWALVQTNNRLKNNHDSPASCNPERCQPSRLCRQQM